MKKKSLILMLLVGAMMGTLLVGCGGSKDSSANTPIGDNSAVENQQEDVVNQESEVIVSTEGVVPTEVATEIPNGEDLPLIVSDETETVDDATFYGLEIVPSGQQVTRAWHIEETAPEGDIIAMNIELPITATVDVTTREDGKLVKTVTYAMQGGINMAGDWTVNIFDYNTGADLEAAGCEVTATAATRSEDGNIAYWSATIVYDETVDPVFLWTQVTTNFQSCARMIDTNFADYIADTNKVLDNYADLLGYEFSFWFLATK